jgi:branched-chain amino acid transport system substrate-binding protein
MQRRHFIASASALVLPSVFAQSSPKPPANALVIGCSAPLTGPLASAGQSVQLGTQAAFEEINAQGGIDRRPLHLSLLDDGYVPDRSVTNVKQLLAQPDVLALMTCVGTANNAATTPLIEASEALHLAPLTGAASLRKPGIQNVYHVRASYNDEVGRLVDNLVSMHLDSLSIVYLDNGFGNELREVGSAALKAKGLKAVSEVPVATDGKGLEATVKAVLDSRPSAMLLFTAGTVSASVVEAVRAASPGMPIAGLSVTFSSAALKQLGPAASGIATTMVVPDAMSTKVALVRRYQKAMRTIGSSDFSGIGFETYINALLMIEALKSAGDNPTRTKIRRSLAGIRNMDLSGFRVDFSEPSTHVGSSYVGLGILSRNGRFIG